VGVPLADPRREGRGRGVWRGRGKEFLEGQAPLCGALRVHAHFAGLSPQNSESVTRIIFVTAMWVANNNLLEK